MPRPRATTPVYALTQRAGVYYVWWRELGNKRRVSCRTSDPVEAARFLAELKASAAVDPPPAAPTVGEVLNGYATSRAQTAHSATLHYAVLALLRHMGDLPVDRLDERLVAAYMAARRAEGCGGAQARNRKAFRAVADGTLLRELGVLRAALAWAVRQRWITTAPYIPVPATPPARERWLTRDEAARLLGEMHTPHVRLFALLALYTAGRSGAILELTWDRVDLAARRIVLGRGQGNKRRATIPIPGPLADPLAEAAAAATCRWVIEFGGDRVGSVRHAFRDAAVRAGLADVTPHVLRHTSATWMVQGGVPLAMVAQYLGNSVRMVERVYGHSAPEWLEPAAAALAGPVSGSTGPAKRNEKRTDNRVS